MSKPPEYQRKPAPSTAHIKERPCLVCGKMRMSSLSNRIHKGCRGRAARFDGFGKDDPDSCSVLRPHG